jgi:hypothetical protein
MTGLPTVVVECAFGTVPSSLTPAWTDITAWVDSGSEITWSWGRADEFATASPGIMSLTLDNTDGRFTMGLTTSPYWPNVKRGRRIRVSCTFNAVTYRLFDGYVDDWPTAWPTGTTGYAETRLTATDRFAKFGRARKLRSILQEEVLYDAPVAYWPLGEPAGSAIASDVSGPQTNLTVTRQGALTGTPIAFAAGVGPPADPLPALMLAPNDGDNGYYLRASNITGAVAGGVSTMEVWFVCTVADPLSAETVMGVTFDDRQSHARLLIVAAGGLRLVANSFDAAGNVATAQVGTALSVVDGHLHHAVAVTTMSPTTVVTTLYVDGALVATQTTATTGKTTPTVIVDCGIGAMPPRYGYPALGMFTGTLAHAAVYGRALTPIQALAHSLAGKTGFAGEKSDVRIRRLARYTGVIDATQLALDAGASPVAAQATDGAEVLAVMQEAAQAEDGQLYMSGDGKLTLHSRVRRYNLTSAFTVHGTTTDDVLADATVFVGDPFQVNDATYSRTDGPGQRATNAASIAEYDTYGDEQTYALTTDFEVLSRANWRVSRYGVPNPRCSSVKVDLANMASTSQVAAVLAATVSTRFTVDHLPSQAPAPSVDLVVEGGSGVLSLSEWSVTFNTSPASTVTNIWQFNAVTSWPLTFGPA